MKFLLPCLALFPALLFAQKKQSAKIELYNGRPTVFLNDRPTPPLLYALTDVPGGRWSWEELPQHNIAQFCADGFRLFQVDLFLEHIFPDEKTFDLALARKQVAGVLTACPDAAVVIRLHVNAPSWWQQLHPGERTVYADSAGYSADVGAGLGRLVEADLRNAERVSLASEKWRALAVRQLERFCRAFARTREGRAVAGLQIAGGVFGEWHYWGFFRWEPDVGPAMTAYFRRWLLEKYATDAALQQAWGDPQARRATAAVPGAARRSQTGAGTFRDPVADRAVIDYYEAQHLLVAGEIDTFCRTVKRSWPRPVLAGAFYGYFFSVFNRQAAGGHLAVQRLLRSPYVDFLAGPQAYLPEADKAGQPYRSRALLLSLRLHGKLWLDEMDQQPRRAYAYTGGLKDNRPRYEQTRAENLALLRRNLMFAHAKGMGLWLYDFGLAGMELNAENERTTQYGKAGYWDDTLYHRTIREVRALYERTLHEPYTTGADVLVVYDTDVHYHLRSTLANPDSIDLQMIDYTSLALYYAGVVFDAVHLDDLDRVELAPYRAVVFANTFLLDAAEKTRIRRRVERDGRHVFWFYAPGYTDGERIDAAYVDSVTGFRLLRRPAGAVPAVAVDSALVGTGVIERTRGTADPIFALADPAADVLGRYVPDGEPAFGRKRFDGYTAWYSAVPLTDYRTWRYALREAGCHIFTENKAIIYAGSGVVTIHTRDGGRQTVQLPNGEERVFSLLPGPQTIIFALEYAYSKKK
jgi:hypothetical protein